MKLGCIKSTIKATIRSQNPPEDSFYVVPQDAYRWCRAILLLTNTCLAEPGTALCSWQSRDFAQRTGISISHMSASYHLFHSKASRFGGGKNVVEVVNSLMLLCAASRCWWVHIKPLLQWGLCQHTWFLLLQVPRRFPENSYQASLHW